MFTNIAASLLSLKTDREEEINKTTAKREQEINYYDKIK